MSSMGDVPGEPSAQHFGPLRRYGIGYRAALARPYALLAGQSVTFFVISLYVKLVQMRDTAEYGAAWVGSGRLLANCLHYGLFCGQEIGMFVGLLVVTALWARCNARPGSFTRCLAWALGLVVLPALSIIEVLGLAHFALFLTPLGPEQLRLIGWTGHIVSAGNVLRSPAVVSGVALAVIGYHVAPPALWLPRPHAWDGWTVVPVGALLIAGVVATLAPKPVVADALLVPHPVLWMLFGSRPERIWDTPDSMVMTPASFPQSVVDGGPSVRPAAFSPTDRPVRAAEPGVTGAAGRRRLGVKQRPTNVLLFLLESTRAASVALYNPAASAGRGLSRLHDEIVVFDHIYAPVPTSAHALFSILYGVYPYLGPFWTGADKAVVADSLAQFFARSGYATHFYITSDLDYDNIRSFAARGFEQVLDTNNWPGQESFALLPWGRDDRLLIDEVKRFITSADRPFFLVAMTSNPHHPYTVDHLPPVPPVEPDDNGRAAYERLVDYDLRLLTELYDWMKERGTAERTLLVVLGDHGEAFGEHPGSFGHAAFIYEENVHIPCFILHPRRLGLPRHIAQLGSQVDLRATILDIMGRTDTERGDGVSLLSSDPERQVVNFTENGVSHFGVRDTSFSYIYTPHAGVEQVFDRRGDPGETRNIAGGEPAITERYRQRLQRWDAQHQLSLARVLR